MLDGHLTALILLENAPIHFHLSLVLQVFLILIQEIPETFPVEESGPSLVKVDDGVYEAGDVRPFSCLSGDIIKKVEPRWVDEIVVGEGIEMRIRRVRPAVADGGDEEPELFAGLDQR